MEKKSSSQRKQLSKISWILYAVIPIFNEIAILRLLRKREECQGGGPEFRSGEAGAEAAKPKRLGDAGGS